MLSMRVKKNAWQGHYLLDSRRRRVKLILTDSQLIAQGTDLRRVSCSHTEVSLI